MSSLRLLLDGRMRPTLAGHLRDAVWHRNPVSDEELLKAEYLLEDELWQHLLSTSSAIQEQLEEGISYEWTSSDAPVGAGR